MEGPQLEKAGTEVWTVDRPAFSFRVTATGGTAPLVWEDPTGIPAGLTWSLDSDVLSVTGTPTEVGQTRFSVTVRDDLLEEATLEATLLVNTAPTISTTELPGATLGAEYGAPVEARDGAPDYSFRIVSSSAAWLGIGSTSGRLDGVPDAVGTETQVLVFPRQAESPGIPDRSLSRSRAKLPGLPRRVCGIEPGGRTVRREPVWRQP